MSYEIVALGELLIDFTENGASDNGLPVFQANPGGAPGNVLAILAKLGHRTAFIGKVGDDMFGRMLIGTLTDCGIDVGGVLIDSSANTTLAFVKNSADGDREFSFFRKPGADTQLRAEEIDPARLDECKIFHFGSLSLTHEPARSATQFAIDRATGTGALISFDPNLRPLLWDSLDEARAQIIWGCAHCDILKVSDDELEFISGSAGEEEGIRYIRKRFPQIKLLLLTKGRRGAVGFWGDCRFSHPSFPDVKTIDTTGAGDTFLGCCLSFVLRHGLGEPRQELLEEMITFANAAASLITTKKGALLSMPGRDEIARLMSGGGAGQLSH